MKRRFMRPQYYALAAAGAFLIAALVLTGVVFKDYLVVRITIGLVGTIAGIGWSSRYYQARLQARKQEVQELRASLLVQAREAAAQEERNRLARNLHDSIKQQIFGISISVAAAEARQESDPEGAREALSDVRRSAQEAMVEMSALLQQLSPAPLEKVGLQQALREQGEALGYRADATVTVEFGPLPGEDRLPVGAQVSLFRIAQEAFSNIARHARADQVRLYLGQRNADEPLSLEIQDNGQGFVPDQAGGGMGLENIRQRVSALGGELDLQSTPGGGTTLRITIPLTGALVSEEKTAERPNHTLNKAFLSGLGGGLVLVIALLYPLYVLVPGRHVEGWPAGSGAFGLVLEVLAALLTVACGFLAARWVQAGSRQGGALAGALAGAAAGAISYVVLGASAAHTLGGGPLLAHGLLPASGRVEAVQILVGAMARMVWWSHAAFWAALLTGSGLGAMGGVLAPPVTDPPARSVLPVDARTVLTLVATTAAFSLISAALSFALLEPTLRAGLVKNSVALDMFPLLEGISNWLIGTPLALYLMALVGLYFPLRGEINKVEDPVRLGAIQTQATWLTLLSLGVPVYLGGVSGAVLQGTTVMPLGLMDVLGLYHPQPVSVLKSVDLPLSIIGLLGSLVTAGLYLSSIRTVHRRRQELGHSPPPLLRTTVMISGLLGLGILSWGANIGAVPQAYIFGGLAVLVSFYIVLIVRLFHTPALASSAGLAQRQIRLTVARLIDAGPGSAIAMAIPPMTVISTTVGMGLMPVKLIEILLGQGGPGGASEITLSEIIGQVYLAQAQAGLLTLIAAAAVVGVLVLLFSGIAALAEQWSVSEANQDDV